MSIVKILNNKHPDLNPFIKIYNDRAKNPFFSNHIPDYLTLVGGSTLFYIYNHISDKTWLTTWEHLLLQFDCCTQRFMTLLTVILLVAEEFEDSSIPDPESYKGI